MWSRVRLSLPDGGEVDLGHGDLIGRLWGASLVLDDPRISEAHALVSQRGHELKLLALRGRFAVNGRTVTEVTLREGQRILLADGLELGVEEVELPATVLGLATDGMPPRVLPGTCALVVQPAPGFAPPGHPTAVAHVWAVPSGWRVRPTGGAATALDAGVEVVAGGRTWCGVEIPLEGAGGTPTIHDTAFDLPLRIVTRYDTVHVFRDGLAPAVLQGLPARLLSELVTFGGPVPWTVLAGELWRDGGSRKQLDMVLVRLRQRLRGHRLRTDLVHAPGTGVIELLLREGDVVEDQT